MARMGHSSSRAALIYQHATRDRDVVIANALDGMIREVTVKSSTANGTAPNPSAGENVAHDA